MYTTTDQAEADDYMGVLIPGSAKSLPNAF